MARRTIAAPQRTGKRRDARGHRALRRLLAAGRLRLVKKGGAAHQAVYGRR